MIFSTTNVIDIAFNVPGISLVLDSSNSQTITQSGGAVSSFRDVSGRLNNAIQGTGASQPITGTQTIGALNAIVFDGTDDFLSLTSNNVFDQPFTMFIVGQSTSISTAQTFISRASGGADGSYVLRVNGDSTNFTSFGTGPGSTFATSNRPVNLNANIHCSKFNLTTVYSINNGTSETSTTLASFDNTNAAAARIGLLANGTQPLSGKVGNVIFFSAILGSTETTNMNRHLSNKWGVAI